MQYNFGKGVITSPLGVENIFPTVKIQDSLKYGDFFASEINHLSSNLDYVKEIVSKLDAVLSGELEFYEGFGYEVYMIECDKEKATVRNIFEDDKVDAVIPTVEVYELMRDWRDYLIDYSNSLKINEDYKISEQITINYTFFDGLKKYYSNPNLDEWNKWMSKYIDPAFDRDRHKELIKNFGYLSIDKHDFKLQYDTFNYLSNDNRLDDQVKKFIRFMAGAGFFKQNNLSIEEWFNINNWSNPKVENAKGKKINLLLSLPYGINCFKINLILMPFWRR